MLEVLSKPLDEIGIADIQLLIDSEAAEGEQIEFKKELPGERGTPDSWGNGENKIGNHAKDTILKEIVAFANAYGGVLLIGIEESDEKPAVAAKISPIPRCNDLAERLKLVFRDRVEPQLARLDIVGVPIEDESGVVVIRVGKSRLAPHRITRTLICPIRQADRSEEMTMRQIQDMTLNVSRGLQYVERQLSDRSNRFLEEFDRLKHHENAFGIRLTAVPVVEEIRFDRVFRQGNIISHLDMPWREVARRTSGEGKVCRMRNPVEIQSLNWRWQPLLRGARSIDRIDVTPPYFTYREIYCNGLVELGHVSIAADEESLRCDPDWPVVLLANLSVWADNVRNQAGAPTVEYALEVELRNLGEAGFVERRTSRNHRLRLPNVKFPRYSLNDPQDITNLLILFDRDFWNSMRRDTGEDVHFVLI